MKKIYILGASIIGVASAIMLLAVILSGFNLYDVNNYGNFKKEEFYEFHDYDIRLINCEYVVINNNAREDIQMIYHTSENIDYEIEVNDVLKVVIVEQIGTDILDSIVPGADKPLTLSIPTEDNQRSIYISTEDRETPIIKVEDIEMNKLTIYTHDTTISLDDIICKDLEVSGNNLIVDFDDIVCNSLFLSNRNGKVRLNKIDFTKMFSLELVECAFTHILLNMPIDNYKLDIELIGESSCTVESTEVGNLPVKIKLTDTKVDLKFGKNVPVTKFI